jgi:hypothetical protein
VIYLNRKFKKKGILITILIIIIIIISGCIDFLNFNNDQKTFENNNYIEVHENINNQTETNLIDTQNEYEKSNVNIKDIDPLIPSNNDEYNKTSPINQKENNSEITENNEDINDTIPVNNEGKNEEIPENNENNNETIIVDLKDNNEECSEGEEKNNFNKNEIKEAELIALYLSGEIVAPDDLFYKVLNNLRLIRSSFNNSENINNISFNPPLISTLLIKFDNSSSSKVKNGTYHDWNELNLKYNVTNINQRLLSRFNLIILDFNYSYHPRYIRNLYENLSGVLYVEIDSMYGISRNIYPRIKDNIISYLFFRGGGDCPSGCIYRKYWYFIFENDQPKLIGVWNNNEDSEELDWWNEAKINIDEFELERNL